mmetsp:Transcript_13301/g.40157  ORF Transcript_13301/g.40157 Transcript_13301/m.40157 type:complete len:239 (+) Transcript_13301:398-1114(+)
MGNREVLRGRLIVGQRRLDGKRALQQLALALAFALGLARSGVGEARQLGGQLQLGDAHEVDSRIGAAVVLRAVGLGQEGGERLTQAGELALCLLHGGAFALRIGGSRHRLETCETTRPVVDGALVEAGRWRFGLREDPVGAAEERGALQRSHREALRREGGLERGAARMTVLRQERLGILSEHGGGGPGLLALAQHAQRVHQKVHVVLRVDVLHQRQLERALVAVRRLLVHAGADEGV